MVPDRKPRTLCACQSVAFISSARVAPSGRLNKSRTLAALLPSLAVPHFFAALGAFLGALAFLAAWPFAGATCARFWPTLAFLLALAFSAPSWAVPASSI